MSIVRVNEVKEQRRSLNDNPKWMSCEPPWKCWGRRNRGYTNWVCISPQNCYSWMSGARQTGRMAPTPPQAEHQKFHAQQERNGRSNRSTTQPSRPIGQQITHHGHRRRTAPEFIGHDLVKRVRLAVVVIEIPRFHRTQSEPRHALCH